MGVDKEGSGYNRRRPGSASHACSSLSAHFDSDAAAGWGFRPRPFGLTGSSAMNSAQGNSDCCASGASSLWPFPMTSWGVASTHAGC